MLHTCLRIDDDEMVIAFQLNHALGEQIIGKAVAPAALRPAHSHEVEPFCLHQGLAEPEPHVIVTVHTGRYMPGEGFLPHAPEGLVHRHAERLVQVCIRVRIHGEHRCFTEFYEGSYKKRAERCLAGPAFTGDGNGEWMYWHSDHEIDDMGNGISLVFGRFPRFASFIIPAYGPGAISPPPRHDRKRTGPVGKPYTAAWCNERLGIKEFFRHPCRELGPDCKVFFIQGINGLRREDLVIGGYDAPCNYAPMLHVADN